MIRRGLMTATAALVVAATLSASAGASRPPNSPTTFSASVTSATNVGSTSTPVPHGVKLDVEIKSGSNGHPPQPATAVVMSVSSQFVTELAHWPVCPAKDIQMIHKRTANSNPCPSNTVLGNGSYGAYVPLIGADGASTPKMTDMDYAGKNKIVVWLRVSAGSAGSINAYVDGTVTQGAGSYGPIINWNLANQANGSYGAVIYTTKLIANFQPMSGAKTPISPFESTGCTGGTWPFQVKVSYKGAPSETLNKSVSC